MIRRTSNKLGRYWLPVGTATVGILVNIGCSSGSAPSAPVAGLPGVQAPAVRPLLLNWGSEHRRAHAGDGGVALRASGLNSEHDSPIS